MQAGTGTLYIKQSKPQPPGPPPPPPTPSAVMYSAINVWPMPTGVTLCSQTSDTPCVGPHMLRDTASVEVSSACSAAVGPLVKETLTLATAFKAPTRTYDESPYANADAFCPRRCSVDADCGGTNGRSASAPTWTCYIPSDRRWDHRQPATCPPTAKYNAGKPHKLQCSGRIF